MLLDDYNALERWGVLPTAGGWRDQPVWWRNAMRRLDKIRRWHELNKKRPDPSGLPRLEDV